MQYFQSRQGSPWAYCALLCAALALGGCEAPLELDAVNAARAKPIQRMDRYQASARSGTHVVVIGNQGVVLRSADNGASWNRIELPGWPALIDLTTCPDGSFVALAYDKKIYRSVDQGATWQDKVITESETPQSITCAPDGKLWVVGSYTSVWSSADSGESWSETTFDEDAIFTTVQFLDAKNGIVTGEFGMIMKTSDGGANWERLEPIPGEFYPQEAYFSDPSNGWLIGLGGTVLMTRDGGVSWSREETGTQVSLFGIEAVGGSLFIVGGQGTMLRYDGGRWLPFDHGAPVRLYLRSITALDDQHCLVGGVGGALHVIDVSGA